MRDPQRIRPMLAFLEQLWREFPDLRLGQLLMNACPPNKDLYYMEDDQLLEQLATMYPFPKE